ncbi:MAG: hypothetical protein JO197_06800 [Acidobacteria bacterium]|nr:hypothetical protein [Acidobacteriota bacterium]MBV9477562.1 hypothetical protein [Acidobacteriota bacterium]
MLLPNDASLRRDELPQLLNLHPRVLDALIASGSVQVQRTDGVERIAAAQLEQLFRDSLLRLYFAQAHNAAIAPQAQPQTSTEVQQKDDGASDILRTGDEHELPATPRADLRAGERYVPRRQLSGTFRDVKMFVLQLSTTGLRIRHEEPLRPGDEARLSFGLVTPPQVVLLRASVVWTSIAQRGDGPSYYVSGLHVTANADRLANALALLNHNRELQRAQNEAKRRGGALPGPVLGLSDDDVVAIIRAARKLATDPTEATRWYTRARFAYAEEDVRKVAPRGAREREEVLGVWEYLQRRIDIPKVAGVMQWIRSSQAAAV